MKERHASIRNAGLVAGVWLLLGAIGLLLGPGEPFSSAPHLFGLDRAGHDIFRRLLAGTLPTLGFAVVLALLQAVLGGIIGAFAGLGVRVVDVVFSRLSEGLSAFPTFLTVLVLQGLVGHANGFTLACAILLTRAPDSARFVRSEVQRLRATGFVLASFALGATRGEVFRRQLPVYVVPMVLDLAKASIVPCVFAETMASLLGVGLETPRTWGAVLGEARDGSLLVALGPTLFLVALILSLRAIEPIEKETARRLQRARV